MRAIVRNTLIDRFRDRKRRIGRELEWVEEELADEREPSFDSMTLLSPELTAALAALPVSQSEAVRLIQVEGLSVAEAVLPVGVSVGAVNLRAHRGDRSLAKSLEAARVAGEWRSQIEPPVASRPKGAI